MLLNYYPGWVGGWMSSDTKANLSPADLATASRCLTGLGWAWQFGEDSKLETMKLWWNYETWRRLQKSIKGLQQGLYSTKKVTTRIVIEKIYWIYHELLGLSFCSSPECYDMPRIVHRLFTHFQFCCVVYYHVVITQTWLAGSHRLGATSCDRTLTTTSIKRRWFY